MGRMSEVKQTEFGVGIAIDAIEGVRLDWVLGCA